MQLIMLIQPEHRPVPTEIEVQEFGHEVVRSEDGHTHAGVSALLTGPKEAFVEWLKPFDGVWLSTNPMLGEWEVCHIKMEQEQT